MNSEDLKRIVKEKYGEIAKGSDGQNQSSCCCQSSDCCSSVDYTVFSESYEKTDGHFCVFDVVIKGYLPDKLRKDAEMYVGCVSGAIDMDEYIEIMKLNGFKNIQTHKQKEISLPDELLTNYLSEDEMSGFNKGKFGIYSITVSGYKQ
jgi:arsenite methyltransferase